MAPFELRDPGHDPADFMTLLYTFGLQDPSEGILPDSLKDVDMTLPEPDGLVGCFGERDPNVSDEEFAADEADKIDEAARNKK